MAEFDPTTLGFTTTRPEPFDPASLGFSTTRPEPTDEPAPVSDEEAIAAFNVQAQRDIEEQQTLEQGLRNAAEAEQLGFVTPEQHRINQFEEVKEEVDESAASGFLHFQALGFNPLTPKQLQARDTADFEDFLTEEGRQKIFGEAKEGLSNVVGQIKSDFKASNFSGLSLKDKAVVLEESLGRVFLQNGFFVSNLAGAAADKLFHEPNEEAAREYKRYLINLQHEQVRQEGVVKHLTGDSLFEISKFDPATLNTVELGMGVASAPGISAITGLGTKVTGAVARNVIKTTAGRVVKPFAAAVETAARVPREAAGKLIKATGRKFKSLGKAGAQKFTPQAFKGLKVPGAVKQAAGIASIPFKAAVQVAAFIPSAALRTIQQTAKFTKDVADVIGSPTRHKRFLEFMATERGSKLAAIAHSSLGTKFSDKLTAAVFEGVTSAGIGGLEAGVAGRSRQEIIAGAGVGGVIGTTIGGVAGISGSGARIGGRQRTRGSFNKAAEGINENKITAIADLYQANQFDKMPNNYKQAVGVMGEMGVAPKTVLYLAQPEFKKAQRQLKGSDLDGEISEGSMIYIAEDDILLLNADNVKSGADGSALIGQTIGERMVSNALENNPGFLSLEAARFADPNGRSMEIDTRPGLGTVKVNKEFSDFVDAFNAQVVESQGKPITTFFQGVNALYSSQAGLAMSGLAQATGLPPWAQTALHKARGVWLGLTNKVVQNRPSSAKSFAQLPDTPLGKQAKSQFKIWQAEASSLKANATRLFKQRENINVGEKVKLARERAARKGIELPEGSDADSLAAVLVEADENSTGTATKPRKPRATQPKQDTLLNIAKEFSEEAVIKKDSTTVVGRLDDSIATEWSNRFPARERHGQIDFLRGLEEAAETGQALTVSWLNEAGEIELRNLALTPEWLISDVKATAKKNADPGRLLIKTRDVDAIHHNLKLAEIDGIIDNFDTARLQLEQEAALLNQDPTIQPSELLQVMFGDYVQPTKKATKLKAEELKPEVVPLDIKTQSLKEFVTVNNLKGDAGLQRTVKAFPIENILAVAENIEGNTAFGQKPGTGALRFTNIPEQFQAQAAQIRQQPAQ